MILRPLAIIESPYAGDVDRNVTYARRAVRWALERGFAPIASHLLYTQPGILDDNNPAERQWGIDAGLAWHAVPGVKTLVFDDYGMSRGMNYGISVAQEHGTPYTFQSIGENP